MYIIYRIVLQTGQYFLIKSKNSVFSSVTLGVTLFLEDNQLIFSSHREFVKWKQVKKTRYDKDLKSFAGLVNMLAVT